MFGALFVAAAMMQEVDVYNLNIGPEGTVKVRPGEITSTSTGKKVSTKDVAKACSNARFVLLGEQHDSAEDHAMQAAVIEALVAAKRDVVVGFEMFTRPIQSQLNNWSLGWGAESDFIVESDWKKQWGFDYALYKPIFDSVRRNRLPMVALNVPRDWVRSVGKGGYAALTSEQRAELPTDLFLGNADHKKVFEGLMGGHPMTGTQGDNIYAAQVLWDEGMADTAIKWMNRRTDSKQPIMVILAGAGHVMYGQGINYRIQRRLGEKSVSMVMLESGTAREVRKTLGDFVYVSH
ncbi:MAG: ChaN family lipoprotein [Armatimonadetes bacterium]|nr:ChaN family lipoprotein [Armatimonadota bacterium]